MRVIDLISVLNDMPPEAHVHVYWDMGVRSSVDHVELTADKRAVVLLDDYEMRESAKKDIAAFKLIE